jgi:hypothetical protein
MITVEGKISFFGIIVTDKIHEVITEDGLYQQKKNLNETDLFNLVKARRGDKVRITIEKVE